MAIALPQQVIDLLADPSSTKVLATVDEQGLPHLALKQSLQLGPEGKVIYLELLETSTTNRNMVRSIWFDGRVGIILRGRGEECFQIKGRPVKTHVTGPVFRKHYEAIRQQLGDVDLAAVWVIEPEQVIDQSFSVRRSEEERKHPFNNHLDRLAKSP